MTDTQRLERFATACTGRADSSQWRLVWLDELLQRLEQRERMRPSHEHDAAALRALSECRDLCELLSAALALCSAACMARATGVSDGPPSVKDIPY